MVNNLQFRAQSTENNILSKPMYCATNLWLLYVSGWASCMRSPHSLCRGDWISFRIRLLSTSAHENLRLDLLKLMLFTILTCDTDGIPLTTLLGDGLPLGGNFVLFTAFSLQISSRHGESVETFEVLKNSSYSGVCSFFKSKAWYSTEGWLLLLDYWRNWILVIYQTANH